MRVKLLVRTKSATGEPQSKVFDLNESYCIVGRKSKAMPLIDNSCSGEHAVLFQDFDGQLRIRDLGSTNGTFVNGNRVVDAAVHVGSEIGLGKTKIKVLEFSPVGVSAGKPISTDAPGSSGLGSKSSRTKESTVVGIPVVKGWPNQFKAVPAARQSEFVEYVDREGTKSRISIRELIEDDDQKKAA